MLIFHSHVRLPGGRQYEAFWLNLIFGTQCAIPTNFWTALLVVSVHNWTTHGWDWNIADGHILVCILLRAFMCVSVLCVYIYIYKYVYIYIYVYTHTYVCIHDAYKPEWYNNVWLFNTAMENHNCWQANHVHHVSSYVHVSIGHGFHVCSLVMSGHIHSSVGEIL